MIMYLPFLNTFLKKQKYCFLFLSVIALFLSSCGGGGSNSDQSPINANEDQNSGFNSSSQDNSSQNTALSTAAKTVIIENRFGECNFGECKFR